MIQIVDWSAFYGYKKFVGMAVHILAFTVIIVKNMGGFEGENFGDAYHGCKGTVFLD